MIPGTIPEEPNSLRQKCDGVTRGRRTLDGDSFICETESGRGWLHNSVHAEQDS